MRIGQPNTISGASISLGVFPVPGDIPYPGETTDWTEVCLPDSNWDVIEKLDSTIDRC